ncbi:MAG TPA: GNAT family N-acetyltransferase [Candidatus Krumholzibacteria bacterium]|nr:GNAT family N-acetyltransferase [Candidatus Krumholzibacteria bacterium]
MHLLTDSNRIRARYADILAHCDGASVYQTPAWLGIWERLGARLEFVQIDPETMLPFVVKGAGLLRRAYSLPFDTYGGPVTAAAGGPVLFEQAIEALGSPSARVADFGAAMASRNGALRPISSHIVDLSLGYEHAAAAYSDANRRNIRQAIEQGVRVVPVSGPAAARDFFRLHARTVQRHDARALPPAFFEAVMADLVPGGMASFYVALHEGRVVAGNLVLRYGQRSYDWMWAYDDRYSRLRATNLMIDCAIRDEAARGSRELNLGASPNDRLGSVRFKQSFGAHPFAYAVYTHTAPLVAAARAMRRGAGRVRARLRPPIGSWNLRQKSVSEWAG